MKPISKERFEALCRSRQPMAAYVSKEEGWFAGDGERVLGLILLDTCDNDWVWMVLGRDEAGVFRCIDLGCSIPTKAQAEALLATKIEEHSQTGQTVFPQHDVNRPAFDLFTPVVPATSLNPNFKILAECEHHSSAREILRELVQTFIDVDGNFVRDFQTTGFNARLWELYLNAFLYEQRFAVAREFDRPDFYTAKDGFPVGIEAVTVNPTPGEAAPNPGNDEELQTLREQYMPIKFGSVLFSKMQKRYWELPHMQGMPFVLAVHDFCAGDSMTWSEPAINDYLFGLRASWRKDEAGELHITDNPIHEHRWGNKVIPSGFFNQPDTEHVSAVLFSNSATLSKFNRMGKIAGFGSPDVKMLRVGVKHNFDPNATEPIHFTAEVEAGTYSENWAEGVRVFHNPRAVLPIPSGVFESCAHHFLEDGRRVAMLPDGFIHSSHMMVIAPKRDAQATP
jgi:hypothetical protein